MSYQTPEQIAGATLLSLGFKLVNATPMPYRFVDKENTEFGAYADFYHPHLDLFVEIKHSHLNGKTSKATAERAYDRIEPERRYGKHAAYFQTRNQWNHAAQKQAIVQAAVTRRGYAIVFTSTPDAETLTRIEKTGIQAFGLSMFASIIELQLACPSLETLERIHQ